MTFFRKKNFEKSSGKFSPEYKFFKKWQISVQFFRSFFVWSNIHSKKGPTFISAHFWALLGHLGMVPFGNFLVSNTRVYSILENRIVPLFENRYLKKKFRKSNSTIRKFFLSTIPSTSGPKKVAASLYSHSMVLLGAYSCSGESGAGCNLFRCSITVGSLLS